MRNVEESKMLAEEGQVLFSDYWKQVIEKYPQIDTAYFFIIAGLIFIAGFTCGYDLYKSKLKELAEKN